MASALAADRHISKAGSAASGQGKLRPLLLQGLGKTNPSRAFPFRLRSADYNSETAHRLLRSWRNRERHTSQTQLPKMTK